MKIGEAIRLCRQQRSLTQGDLAKSADVSVSYLSLLERGERSDPGLAAIERISKGLGIPLSLLLFLASDEGELEGLSPEVIDKLSTAVLRLMKESA